MTEYAFTHADRVEKLILIAPVLNIGIGERPPVHPLVDVDVLRTGILSMVLRLDSILLDRFRSFVFKSEQVTPELLAVYIRSFDTKGTSARLSQWVKDYLSDPLQELASTRPDAYAAFDVPVRFIWGEEDTLTPIADGRYAESLLPNALFTPLQGIGHIPMIEDVARFNDAFAQALRDRE
jgi:pimeloyl-ACP methyl ester carboxylesterase